MKALFGSFRLVRFLQLAGTVILVSLVSLWPFLNQTQLVQLGQRLFPFKRGLCHAYWAPNWWALYAAMDRVMALSGLMPKSTAEAGVSTTAGLVRDSSFVFLPDVRPVCTILFSTLLFQLPALWGLWKHST
uniref:Alpha-1,3-glucosyltransferase n=2 Tax=Ixodes ricinus TaxID=34613 RepID=V5IDA0_IXORI